MAYPPNYRPSSKQTASELQEFYVQQLYHQGQVQEENLRIRDESHAKVRALLQAQLQEKQNELDMWKKAFVLEYPTFWHYAAFRLKRFWRWLRVR